MNAIKKIITAIIIAIDGVSGSGKGTTAKLVAKALGYKHIDTGSMYRAVTLYYLEHGSDIEKLVSDIQSGFVKISFILHNGETVVTLNGEMLGDRIRNQIINTTTPIVAKDPRVREYVVAIQHKLGEEGGIVMEGRDIGSVVFPNAELKVFLDCSPEERARRRQKELEGKGEIVSFEEVLQTLLERDQQDSEREHSPLVRLPDAFVVDTTNLTIEQQVQKIVDEAQRRMEQVAA